jgi:hypothetical protein
VGGNNFGRECQQVVLFAVVSHKPRIPYRGSAALYRSTDSAKQYGSSRKLPRELDVTLIAPRCLKIVAS